MLEFHCKIQGATGMSFTPVVAQGDNATTLHYISNTQKIEWVTPNSFSTFPLSSLVIFTFTPIFDLIRRRGFLLSGGNLLLIDAGAQYWGYCSDITRTYPFSKQFTPAQKVLYELVLSVNQRCIQVSSSRWVTENRAKRVYVKQRKKKGKKEITSRIVIWLFQKKKKKKKMCELRPEFQISLDDIHVYSCRLIRQGLIDLGILKQQSVSLPSPPSFAFRSWKK